MILEALFWQQIRKLALNEPERSQAGFFDALLRLQGDSQFAKTIGRLVLGCDPRTAQHLPYLFWAATRYCLPASNRLAFNMSGEMLRELIESNVARITHVLSTRHIQTNILNRYYPLALIVNLFSEYNNQGCRVLDVGCASGFGLDMVARKMPSITQVFPADGSFLKYATQVDPKAVLEGIDIEEVDPFDMDWLHACMVVDDESAENFRGLARSIECQNDDSATATILKRRADARYLAKEKSSRLAQYDIVWTSSMLYQISDSREKSMSLLREQIEPLLKPTGVWINADYESWNRPFGMPGNRYCVSAQFMRFNSKSLNLFTAKDDNCKQFDWGEDLEEFRGCITEVSRQILSPEMQ